MNYSKIILVYFYLIAFLCISLNTRAQTEPILSKDTIYRLIDREKDGFTVNFESKRIEFISGVATIGDIADLKAYGIATNIKGAEVILLKSGKCINNKIETNNFGIIKIKMNANFTGEIMMTQNSIDKIKKALENSLIHQ